MEEHLARPALHEQGHAEQHFRGFAPNENELWPEQEAERGVEAYVAQLVELEAMAQQVEAQPRGNAALRRGAGRAIGGNPATPVDVKIQEFLDGSYGKNRWQSDRDPWIWERHGGDVELDRLFADQDAALANLVKCNNLMWQAKDDLRAAGAAATVSHTKALASSIKAWEAADEAASRAR